MGSLDTKPLSTKKFNAKQSKYAMCAELPTRSILLGLFGSGKSVLLQNIFFRSQAQRLSDSDGGACDACQKLKTAAVERRGEEKVLC